MSRRAYPIALGLVAALLIGAGAWAVAALGDGQKRLTAHFPNTINLYAGAEVQVLGVGIGTVDDVRVEGTEVRVDIGYDSDRQLPADVHAAVVPPSIVGDRVVQLTPPYTGGPALPDGASLDSRRGAVPVELDDTYRNLNHLAHTLGPAGANSDGSLSRLISSMAETLRGNGGDIHRTTQDLSQAVDTLAGHGGDIGATVTGLGKVTGALAQDDPQLRTLVGNLATVSGELNQQRGDIRGATESLRGALGDITGFVQQSRRPLTENIAALTQVSQNLGRHRRDLAEVVDLAPLGLTGLYNSVQPQNYDPARPGAVAPQARTATVAARPNLLNDLPTQLGHVLTAVCGLLPPPQQQQLAPLCIGLQRAGGDVGSLAGQLLGPIAGGGVATAPPASTLPGLLLGGRP